MSTRKLVWPVAGVQLRDGRVRLIFPDNTTRKVLVRGGIVWPRVVGPVQLDGYVVVAAMDTEAADESERRTCVYEHGPFAAIEPVLRDNLVVRPGLVPILLRAQGRYAVTQYFCEDGGAARDHWRVQMRRLRSMESFRSLFRYAMNFGEDRAAHLLWRVEQTGTLLMPRDLHDAQAAAALDVDAGKGVSICANAPRFALALAVQALTHANDREGFTAAEFV